MLKFFIVIESIYSTAIATSIITVWKLLEEKREVLGISILM